MLQKRLTLLSFDLPQESGLSTIRANEKSGMRPIRILLLNLVSPEIEIIPFPETVADFLSDLTQCV